MIARILRVLSYLYHFALAIFLIGMAVVAISSSVPLRLEMLPWTGTETAHWLLWGGLIGLLSIVLAQTGKFRFLFPVYALVVLVLMVRGFLLKPYSFSGKPEFYQVLYLIAGALVAFLASLTLFTIRKRRI